jgi:hypothetical protein
MFKNHQTVDIVKWFAVGVMWKDKAIMIVHVGAFILGNGNILGQNESSL